jgi:hypothetical protein
LAALVLVGVLAAACGGGSSEEPPANSAAPGDASSPTAPVFLLSSDYEQVCGGGTISQAAPYEKGPGLHPLIVFEGEDPEYEYMSLTLPEGWQSQEVSIDNTELVACLDRTSEKKDMVCPGYESDDFPEPFDVELFSATWNVTLYAANTGEEVASGEISAADKDCPFIVFYEESEDVQREYADVSDQLRGFVKKYVSP